MAESPGSPSRPSPVVRTVVGKRHWSGRGMGVGGREIPGSGWKSQTRASVFSSVKREEGWVELAGDAFQLWRLSS